MSLTDLFQQKCCRRRSSTSNTTSSNETRRERALRILSRKQREIYERARERAKVAPSFVQDLGNSGFIVNAKTTDRGKGGIKALATPPLTLTFTIPEDYVCGQSLHVDGPHGRMQVAAPPNPQPGTTHHIRLGPPPEFKIGIPPGAKPGTELTFKKPDDGLEISVAVPPSLQAGDSFDVPPPALMVRVPESAGPGDTVIFRRGKDHGDNGKDWCRAKVPDGAAPGDYFAARIPPPEGVPKAAAAVDQTIATTTAEEWKEEIDLKTGKAYYWNTATRETSWTSPIDKKLAADQHAKDVERALRGRIQELETEAAGQRQERRTPEKRVVNKTSGGAHRRPKTHVREA